MITVNMQKAKAIAHDMRRRAREQEFAPHDKIISAQIPGQSAVDAEAARAAIRSKYAEMQEQIEAATTIDALKACVEALEGN
jgi:hypothetical protein